MDSYDIHIPAGIKSALDKLHQAGYEAYAAGGCVRDTFLGKEPHDWDIATSAAPKEVQAVFEGYRHIDTGLKHGMVIVEIDREPVEITTFRIDGKYSDGRRPDNVTFTSSIAEDLSRRDFSINACAIADNILVDPFGGQEDAKNKVIRCVGNPIQRFTEDALRILRGIRFASVLNFKVEEKTKAAMFECRHLLENISQERITVEFCKTLAGINVKNTLLEFKDIVAYILPEIKEMVGFEHHNQYHIYDVYEHSLKAVESIESDNILRVAMFFHDIGKPSCYSSDKNNVGHFYGHSEISAVMTEKILQRMKFSTADKRTIIELIKYHNTQMGLTSKSVKKLLLKLGVVQLRRLLKVKKADIMAQNPSFANNRIKDLDIVELILDDLIATNSCISLRDLAINGDDLIQLGIPEGKRIRIVLNRLLEMVLDEETENSREVLLEKAKAMQFI
ncbi:MAG: HD domain-containing protein [Ruminiclostridium sp.]|nr:HD domain-containing protein [Ruminiclostridium sp.]